MKRIGFLIILLLYFMIGCNNEKEECTLSDLEQQSLVRLCKTCHTNYGFEELPNIPTYIQLQNIGKESLLSKMQKLKGNDKNHEFMDSLSFYELNCIVEYINRHSNVKPSQTSSQNPR